MPILSAIGAACVRAFGMFGGSTVSASYLVVAGGGGGGGANSSGSTGKGGGGAGGLKTGTTTLDLATSYTITVGSGGAAGPSGNNNGSNGSNSVFSSFTSTGGGGGGTDVAGLTGGSGGGGSSSSNSGGAGTSGQGNNGGAAASGINNGAGAGGGGGASAVGSNGSGTTGGAGGAGTASSISGSSVTYAGGGGGGGVTGGSGGSGGGANGGSSAAGSAGTNNTGGGGGGAGNASASGGNGGSGIVIISYAGTQKFGGGVVTSVGGNTIHTFTTSGSLTPISPITASYLIVAGGGGGGATRAGGGGAGGLLSGSGLTIDPYSTYLVTVGAGGVGGTNRNSTAVYPGSDSSFISTTATGGGKGGNEDTASGTGGSGGGGGGGTAATNGSAGTSGQGYAGGNGNSSGNRPGGGGGGAGGVGANSNGTDGGAGGAAYASSISGTSTYYAGGGGGGTNSGSGGLGGGTSTTSQKGGGGDGGGTNVAGGNGTANTGGGGGGGGFNNTSGMAGGQGGSGIVIISYPGSTQLMAGGTVTIVGGNVIHTFTSTGYLAPIKYLSNSLRFRSSASAYLQRAFSGSQTLNTKATVSAWVKLGTLGVDMQVASGVNDAASIARYFAAFRSSPSGACQFGLGNDGNYLETTQVFRDPAAWYHIVASYDSTQATASDRVKIYVNGNQVTAFSTANYPAQNTAFALFRSTNTNNRIGSQGNGGQYFDGYITEFNFIDGQALTPNSFGTFNSYGVWQPIAYAGSYGNWGFYLPFSNTSSTTTLGYDYSGNSNNWTTNNISLTAGTTYDAMTDVPTLTSATASNFATLNPIFNPNGTIVTYSDANLAFSHSASSGNAPKMTVLSTISLPASKTYWEYTVGATVNDQVGIGTMLVFGGSADGTAGARYLNNGTFQSGYTNPSTAASYTTNDIIGMAYDQPNGTLAFYKNNSLQGTITNISTSEVFFALRSPNSSGSGGAGVFNFGQRPFSYTPPSGFVALNTYNM